MNLREHFEAWHKVKYGYISTLTGTLTGTAMNIVYQTTACQQRWEGWQGCANQHNPAEQNLKDED